MTYFLALLLSFSVALAATPAIRGVAIAKGWLDNAYGSRKIHGQPKPRVGGVAIALAFYAPLLGVLLSTSSFAPVLENQALLTLGLFLGGGMTVALGFWDDLFGSTAALKLGGQVVIAAVMWIVGFRVEMIQLFGTSAIDLGWLGLPVTLLWFVGLMNAMNLIDGLDGLAAGIAMLAVLPMLVLAVVAAKPLMILFMCCLLGALLGFLVFNFHPASIFMGDSGSMFLGTVLAATAINTNSKNDTAIAIAVPILALGVPILDTLLVIVRRRARGLPLMAADRGHLHHRLIHLGISHRRAVLLLYTLGLLFVALAFVASFSTRLSTAATLLFMVLLVFVILHRSHFVREVMGPHMPSTRRRNRGFHSSLKKLRADISAATDVESLQQSLEQVCQELPILDASLHLQDTSGKNQSLELELGPANGRVDVDAYEPWSRALVVDGQEIGHLRAKLDVEAVHAQGDPTEGQLLLDRLADSVEGGLRRWSHREVVVAEAREPSAPPLAIGPNTAVSSGEPAL